MLALKPKHCYNLGQTSKDIKIYWTRRKCIKTMNKNKYKQPCCQKKKNSLYLLIHTHLSMIRNGPLTKEAV